MRSIARSWRTVLLTLPVIGAIGFGASQALAAPTEDASRGARVCFPESACWDDCPVEGGYRVSADPDLPCRCCFF